MNRSNLLPRDKRMIDRFDLIIKSSLNEFLSVDKIFDLMPDYSRETIRADCKKLTDEGYLEFIFISTEKYCQTAKAYKALKQEYSLKDYIPSHIKRANKISENINKEGYLEMAIEYEEKKPGSRIIKFNTKDLIKALHKTEELTRQENKAKRHNHHCGSSFSMMETA